MMKIEQTHADQVKVLTAELAHARWQVRIRDEMLRIVTGGDPEIIDELTKQAVQKEIEDGSINDNLAE
jgi:hypothetical protein